VGGQKTSSTGNAAKEACTMLLKAAPSKRVHSTIS